MSLRTPGKQATEGVLVAGNLAKMMRWAGGTTGLPKALDLRLGLSGGTGDIGAGLSSLMSTVTACPPDHQVLGAGCHCAALPAGPNLGVWPPLHQQRVSGHGLSLHHLQRLPGGLHLCLSLRLTEKGEGGRTLLRDSLDY